MRTKEEVIALIKKIKSHSHDWYMHNYEIHDKHLVMHVTCSICDATGTIQKPMDDIFNELIDITNVDVDLYMAEAYIEGLKEELAKLEEKEE